MKIKPIVINGDLVLSLAVQVSQAVNDEEPFEYYCDITLDDRLKKCSKASKKTLLHEFIETICMDGLTYIMRKHFDQEAIDYMKEWFDTLNISHDHIILVEETDDYSALETYADNLQRLFDEEALDKISHAVFAVLFTDKDFLYRFNLKITEQILKLKKADYPELMQGDGYLNRENPPQWLKDGVFNRDRGRCQSCGTNLDRIFCLEDSANYDHIIPLRQGGSNDPTNYQLMCESCNKKKKDLSSSYKNIIWPYWNNE